MSIYIARFCETVTPPVHSCLKCLAKRCNKTAEYSVCDGWANGDVDGLRFRRLARSSQRGT